MSHNKRTCRQKLGGIGGLKLVVSVPNAEHPCGIAGTHKKGAPPDEDGAPFFLFA